jgi:hypothetical protein
MDRNKILYGMNSDDGNEYSESQQSQENNSRKKSESTNKKQKIADDLIRSKNIKNAISSDMINQLTNSSRNEISCVITNLLQEIEQQQSQNEENLLNNENRDSAGVVVVNDVSNTGLLGNFIAKP